MSLSGREFRRILYPSSKNGGAGRIVDYSIYTHKVCSKCRLIKQVSQFRKEKRASVGIGWHYRSWCNDCLRPKYRAFAEKYRRARGVPEKKAAPAEVRKERQHIYSRRYYLKNAQRERLRKKLWKVRNPEKCRFHEKRRRILKMGAEGSHTFQQWQALKRQYLNMCPYCWRREPEVRLTRDHVVPLIKGGSDYIENIQPLCFSCNSSKKDSMVYRYETDLMRFSGETYQEGGFGPVGPSERGAC